ncbi:unnamed protein product, partial [Medioppia subpectinata]
MSMKCKPEIDFKRLLNKCQQMVENDMKDKNHNNWRLERYIQALNQRLKQLKELNVCQVNETNLANYSKKVHFLNQLIESQQLMTSSDRLMATQILSPICVNQSNALKSDKTKEIHLNVKTRAENDIRSELFFSGKESNDLRKRETKQESNSTDDFDTVVKYQNSIQERVAKEMLELTHNLKHNVSLSNEIIKKDTESLDRSAGLAQKNTDSLKTNTDKIGDFVRRSCQYWLWIMLFIVSFTFL